MVFCKFPLLQDPHQVGERVNRLRGALRLAVDSGSAPGRIGRRRVGDGRRVDVREFLQGIDDAAHVLLVHQVGGAVVQAVGEFFHVGIGLAGEGVRPGKDFSEIDQGGDVAQVDAAGVLENVVDGGNGITGAVAGSSCCL